jgi:hypothetical protein
MPDAEAKPPTIPWPPPPPGEPSGRLPGVVAALAGLTPAEVQWLAVWGCRDELRRRPVVTRVAETAPLEVRT